MSVRLQVGNASIQVMPDEVLSKATIAYLGMAGRLKAESPEDGVVAALGDPAVDLIPRIKAIVDALYAADPPLSLAPSAEQLGENACSGSLGAVLRAHPARAAGPGHNPSPRR